MTDRQAKAIGTKAAATMVDRAAEKYRAGGWSVLVDRHRVVRGTILPGLGHIEPIIPWPRTAEESRRFRIMLNHFYPDPWYKRLWIWIRDFFTG